MGNGLAGSGPIIDSDVVALWVELLLDGRPGPPHKVLKICLLISLKFKERADVALRDDQRVSWRDWKAISNHHAMLAGFNDPLKGQAAKSTRFEHWASLKAQLKPRNWLPPCLIRPVLRNSGNGSLDKVQSANVA